MSGEQKFFDILPARRGNQTNYSATTSAAVDEVPVSWANCYVLLLADGADIAYFLDPANTPAITAATGRVLKSGTSENIYVKGHAADKFIHYITVTGTGTLRTSIASTGKGSQ